MTRFARAKGSKASNERREEEPTPWHVMRQQLADQLSIDSSQKNESISYKLNDLLNSNPDPKEEVWCEFSEQHKSDIGSSSEGLEKKKRENGEENFDIKKKKPKLKAKKKKETATNNVLSCNTFESESQHFRAEIVSSGCQNKELSPTVNKLDSKNKCQETNTEKLTKNRKKTVTTNLVSCKSIATNSVLMNYKTNDSLSSISKRKKKDGKQVCSTDKEKQRSRVMKSNKSATSDQVNHSTTEESCNCFGTKVVIHGDSQNEKSNKDELFCKNLNKKGCTKVFSNNGNSEIHNKAGSSSSKKQTFNGNTNNKPKISLRPKESSSDNLKSSSNLDLIKNNLDKPLNKSTSLKNGEKMVNMFSNNFKQDNSNFYDSITNYDNSRTIIANGREITVVSFQGFLIKRDDAIELRKLRKKLKSQNIPKDKIKAVMKLERRKAEKALTREKTKVCYQCRQFGHALSDCPDLKDKEASKCGMCFKCGSTEHTYFQCKVLQNQEFRFAVCFVCNEQGHIARQCPLNPQGQYPKGGSCHLCGEVTHLRKDCPKALEVAPSRSVTVEKLKPYGVEDVGEENHKKNKIVKKNKVVTF